MTVRSRMDNYCLMLVGDIIRRNSRQTPNRLAIVDGENRLTFRQYERRVNRVANALIDRGLERQDRISIFSPNGSPYLEVYGAGEVSGIIVNTVNFRLVPEEVCFILGDADPRVVFFDAAETGVIAAIRASLPAVRHFVRIGGDPADAPEWSEPYETFVASGSPENPAQSPKPEDTAYLRIKTRHTHFSSYVPYTVHRIPVFRILISPLEGAMKK